MKLTNDQRARIAQIVSDRNGYIDIGSFGGADGMDGDEWLDLAQDFAAATAEIVGADAEAIVRDLAVHDPAPKANAYHCTMCGNQTSAVAGHADSCAWRRAVEWVAAHPEESPGPCEDCERCTWNPGPDCNKQDHPHCTRCGHCKYRHSEQDYEPERFAPD